MQHDMDSNNNFQLCSITVIDKQNNKTHSENEMETHWNAKLNASGQRQTRLGKPLQASSSPAVQHYNSYVVQVAVQRHSNALTPAPYKVTPQKGKLSMSDSDTDTSPISKACTCLRLCCQCVCGVRD